MPVILNNSEEMLDPNTFSAYARMKTFAWRHKVEVKSMFADKTTRKVINTLCRSIIDQLNKIIEAEKKATDIDADERGYYISGLEDLIDDFDDLIGDKRSIPQLEKNFNYCLDALYDLGDTKMELKNGQLQKFMWIN